MNSSSTPDKWEQIFVTKFQFIAWGIIGFGIAISGLVGNLVTIGVLTKHTMRNSTGVYLLVLATFDIVVLVSFVGVFSIPVIFPQLSSFTSSDSFFVRIMYPISLTAQTTTVYITVGFTMERYIAIRYPLKAANWCTRHKAKRIAAYIVLSSTIYNIPRMLENVLVPIQSPQLIANTSIQEIHYVRLGDHETYRKVYNIYMYTIVMFFAPFVLLFVLNLLLLLAVQRSSVQTRESRYTGPQRRNETNLTIMLISVVIVFLVCQAFALLDNILVSFLSESLTSSFNYLVFYTFTQVMVVINSAINFVMYCLFGKKFRQTLLIFVCRIRRRQNNSRLLTGGNIKSDVELRQRPLISSRGIEY